MSDSTLYARLLFPKGYGYPLFHPQPFDDLPEPARRTGTRIGDVGVVTQDGSFDPIFNICLAASDPANRFGVPQGFEQVVLGADHIATRDLCHLPGSDIANTTVSKKRLDVEAGFENNVFLPVGAGAVVEVSTNSKQTGLLLLPDGASRSDLRPLQLFRDYALKHTQSWYAFVNGDLNRMIGNGDLYLVTGFTKSTSWSVAAVENYSGDGKVSLKLKAAQVSGAGASCAWEWENASSSVDSGPRRRVGEESWRNNQTVFLRGFKVALRSTPLKRSPKVVSIVNSKSSDILSKTTSIPFSQPRSGPSQPNSFSQSPPTTPSRTGASTDEASIDYISNLYHPSCVLNEHLLDCVPDAVVAVTHDDEWVSILNQADDQVPEHDELIRRISNKYNINIASGGVYLDAHSADNQENRIPMITWNPNPADTPKEEFNDTETRPTAQDSSPNLPRQSPCQDPASLLPSAPHVALPARTSDSPSPIMPLSASPGYNPPVSHNPRAYAQHPTYINLPAAPSPVVLSTPPQEEVCIQCAMRDQDMIDVDVTTPGVWERDSDVIFEDLLRRELEEEASGVVDFSCPRACGAPLTEQNLKVWSSITRERTTSTRQQALNTYIKSQHTLLEAEALARARAMQEAKQLDTRMRDTYSKLRRSAYDTGNSPTPADDSGGVCIKSPNHPARSHSCEVTLLENGMIVEHVDVRKEEKEARERRRKEEKRARKPSRTSIIDVNSIISAQCFNPDSGLKPYSRYSQVSSAQPTSVLTAPLDRELPRAYSQASFSDIHSLGSRRTPFFGMKNLSAGWRSQDSLAPSGISGSMMDIHVALQSEAYGQRVSSPVDLNMARRSQLWPPMDQDMREPVQDKTKKKKGFAKIWGVVTGSSKHQNNSNSREPSQSYERNEDDGPLAPPPSLSYLVNRGRASDGGRHASTPSLPSTISPKVGLSSLDMSPPTAPSSILLSPASSRGLDVDAAAQRKSNGTHDDDQHPSDDTIGKSQMVGMRNVHPVTSEPDLRRASQSPSPPSRLSNGASRSPRPRPDSVMSFRDKSLPPLPIEAFARPPDARPRTVMSYNPLLPPGSGPAHDFLPPQTPFTRSAVQTVPVMQPVAFDQRRPFEAQYGLSRRSLGRLDNVQEHPAVRSSPGPSATKRRSRFGLSALLGKKSSSQNKGEAVEADIVAQHFPSMRRSGSEGADDVANGYATSTSTSRLSAFSMGGPRMSLTSRKALEDLVAQDPDFVAYRYPSNDQHLDILR